MRVVEFALLLLAVAPCHVAVNAVNQEWYNIKGQVRRVGVGAFVKNIGAVDLVNSKAFIDFDVYLHMDTKVAQGAWPIGP